MKRLALIFCLTIVIQSCQSQTCKYISEIGFIYTLKNKTDQDRICKEYEANRELFFALKNSAKDKGVGKISEILINANVSEYSVDEFLRLWEIVVEEHRSTTEQRDSIYAEGIICLNAVMQARSKELNIFINENRELVASSLSSNQLEEVKQGISEYRKFNKSKKQDFLEEEQLLYGQLGEHIINYNQLSFDCMEAFMTSQYSFGLKSDYSNRVIALYTNNQTLDKVFRGYRLLEEKIVEEITSEQCFKRIGILRYHDGLNEEAKQKVIMVNMLMNLLK